MHACWEDQLRMGGAWHSGTNLYSPRKKDARLKFAADSARSRASAEGWAKEGPHDPYCRPLQRREDSTVAAGAGRPRLPMRLPL